jgi:hypothetical protein
MEFELTCNYISPNECVKNLGIIIASIVDYLTSLELGYKNLKIRFEFTANFKEAEFEVNLIFN